MKLNKIIKPFRSFISLLLILLFILNGLGQIRPPEISHYFQTAPPKLKTFFKIHGRFGGGVVPYGTAEFLTSPKSKVRLKANQLKLVINERNKNKLLNDQPDYDVFGIQWKNKEYRFAAQDDLVLPMMKFIQRQGGYIAYSMGRNFNKTYVEKYGLDPTGISSRSYVAKEFNSKVHIKFLRDVDLFTEVESIDDPVFSEKIMNDAENFNGDFEIFGSKEEYTDDSSYINADFNVKYQALLDGKKKLVDVEGMPFRYYWTTESGKIYVDQVDVFTFPEEEYDEQYRAILFFQAAAILRQFKQDNPGEFNALLTKLTKIVSNKPTG